MTFLDSFIPQLLATLVGAGVGIYGVRLAFRWQRTATEHDAVDRAVEQLLQRISERVEAVDAYNKEFRVTRWDQAAKMQRTFPHAAPVSIACEFLRMYTRGEERQVADEIAATWSVVAHAPADAAASAAGVMATAITAWRLGEPFRGSLETARQLSLAEDEFEVTPDED